MKNHIIFCLVLALSLTSNSGANIFTAIDNNKLAEVQAEVTANPNVISSKFDAYTGMTPLMRAAMQGRQDIFDFLVSRGASLTEADNAGFTPIIYAANGGHVAIVKQIVAKNPKTVQVITKSGETPVLAILSRYTANIQDKRVVPNTKEYLHKIEDIIQFLLNNGVPVNAKNNAGTNALMLAAGSGLESVVDILLSKGADICAKGPFNRTVSDFAANQTLRDKLEHLEEEKCWGHIAR